MPMFVCGQCGCAENTACGLYWMRVGKAKLCSECHKGQWHGKFPKMTAEAYIALYGTSHFIALPAHLKKDSR